MKKIINKIIMAGAFSFLLPLSSFLFTSCDSELDIEKHGNLGSMDDFYTTDENIMQATASLYTQMRSFYFNWFFTKNLLADDAARQCGDLQHTARLLQLQVHRPTCL